mgnify:CR=1 FL=1
MLGRNLPDLRELAEVGKILAWLGFARPLPRHVDSRPAGPAFDAFPTSAKPPGANPPPDLREGPQWHTRRPTSAKPQSGKIPARPPRKSGGRENSCRANPGPTFWPGDFFGSIFGSRKTYFCQEMILWWGYKGIPPAQMNSMVPRTHMGRLLCPQTPLKNKF